MEPSRQESRLRIAWRGYVRRREYRKRRLKEFPGLARVVVRAGVDVRTKPWREEKVSLES